MVASTRNGVGLGSPPPPPRAPAGCSSTGSAVIRSENSPSGWARYAARTATAPAPPSPFCLSTSNDSVDSAPKR